jgi:N-acetylmuramoyl-L-alanine amidase
MSDAFRRDSTIAYYKPVLRDVTVFVDPGHGGNDSGAMGPAGEITEADLNLRVALRLRDYLKKAGANVITSRDTDRLVMLDARAQQANANHADVFVSIHHNAARNPYTDYTTTFYHARPGEMGYAPSSHDLARYIQRDLSYVMGNSGPLASFDGTMSDYSVSPGRGFAVLREAEMTAVLVECAFLSSRYEEQRLMLPEFNDIQAWGIFRGIAKYFEAGIPQLRYASPVVFAETMPRIELEVLDRSDIVDESIRVYIDGQEAGYSFNRNTGKLTVNPFRELSHGYHYLTAQVRNSSGNSSAPFGLYFAVGNPPVTLRANAEPAMLPPDPTAYSVVSVHALDSAGTSVRDGLPVRFTTSNGVDTMLTLHNGVAIGHVYATTGDRVTYTASNGPVMTEGIVTMSATASYTRGIVLGTDGKPVRGAEVLLPGGRSIPVAADGSYVIASAGDEPVDAVVRAPGYFGKSVTLQSGSMQDPVALAPVARGTLLGREFILDETETRGGSANRIDRLTAEHFASLLRGSGAKVIEPSKDSAQSLEQAVAAHPEATVFLFDAADSRTITLRANRERSSRDLGLRMQRVYPSFTGIPLNSFVLRIPWQKEIKGVRQILVELPLPSARTYGAHLAPLFSWNIAWATYSALLSIDGYEMQGTRKVEVTVYDTVSNEPAPFVEVELNHALRGITDGDGTCRFYGISISDDNVRVLDGDQYIVKGVTTELIR